MNTALDVAHAAGLQTRRHGEREWMQCPLHTDKTPSLCLYPDGRFYCFSCHAHGDGAALYQLLYGGTMGDALKACGRRPEKRRKTAGELLRQKVKAWYNRTWDEACKQRQWAGLMVDCMRIAYGTAAADHPAFWVMVRLGAEAETRLDQLADATPAELVDWMGVFV